MNGALAQRYPDDRFAFLAFQPDTNFSAFSYEKFYADISRRRSAATTSSAASVALARWQPDLANCAAPTCGRTPT